MIRLVPPASLVVAMWLPACAPPNSESKRRCINGGALKFVSVGK